MKLAFKMAISCSSEQMFVYVLRASTYKCNKTKKNPSLNIALFEDYFLSSSSLGIQYSFKTLKITYCCMRGYLQKYLHKFHKVK